MKVFPLPCTWLVLLAGVMVLTQPAPAAVVDAVLWNNTTNGIGDEPAGLTTVTGSSSPLFGVDDPRETFGQNSGPVEPGTFLFADGATADNGNGILGDGGEHVDFLTWSTNSWVIVSGYRAILGSENPTQNRGTELFQMSAEGEVDDFFDDNAQTGFTQPFVDRLFAIDQVAQDFRVDLTRHVFSGGPRIMELDAITPDPMPSGVYLDPVVFNAETNGAGDEAAGLGRNYAASSKVSGIDTIEDAFGNNDGAVEPSSFIFGDAGAVADNGNNSFDIGVETIDFLSWDTRMPITLAGYQIDLASDGASEYRGTELLAFYVDNVLVDILDMNGATGTFQRAFQGGPVRGDSFRIELTRAVFDGGPRIFEIDAMVVPELGSLSLLAGPAIIGAVFAVRRRRVESV